MYFRVWLSYLRLWNIPIDMHVLCHETFLFGGFVHVSPREFSYYVLSGLFIVVPQGIYRMCPCIDNSIVDLHGVKPIVGSAKEYLTTSKGN